MLENQMNLIDTRPKPSTFEVQKLIDELIEHIKYDMSKNGTTANFFHGMNESPLIERAQDIRNRL
jgi:hypothetical protein